MDLVARFGGEEFAVVLPELDYEGTRDVAQRFCSAVAELKEPHAVAIGGWVTVSVGFTSIVPPMDVPAEQLMELADAALYESKRSGRNRATGRTPVGYGAVVHQCEPQIDTAA